MLRALIRKFIIDKIPDKVKLFLFFGTAFWIGYVIGDFCYESYEDVVLMMCQIHQPQ